MYTAPVLIYSLYAPLGNVIVIVLLTGAIPVCVDNGRALCPKPIVDNHIWLIVAPEILRLNVMLVGVEILSLCTPIAVTIFVLLVIYTSA